MRNEKDEPKRTQVDDITSKVGPGPRLVKPESTNVKGVAAIVDIDGDLGSPIVKTYVSAPNIAPLTVEFLGEGL